MSVLASAVPVGRLSFGRSTVCQEVPSQRATAKVDAPGKDLAGQPGVGGAHRVDTIELLNAGRGAEEVCDPP
jgi:hypothetical protein